MAVFRVLNTDDSGVGSLRQAIIDANEQEGSDRIVFDRALKNQTITLTSGELLITDDLNIRGLGAEQLTVSGGGNSRVFNIDDGTDELIGVHIVGLEITDGFSNNDNNGGGIRNTEKLTIKNSTIADNTTGFANGFVVGQGGGIYNDGGILNLVRSNIIENTAFDGGGIFNTAEGTVKVRNSNISRNTPLDNAGGIYNMGTVEVRNSSINDNTAGDDGGGIFNMGTLEVINSNISGNSTNTGGGGIANNDILRMKNSEINNNTAGGSGGGIFNGGQSFSDVRNSDITGNSTNTLGGGIFNSGTGSFELRKSNITGNTANENGGGIFNNADRFGNGMFEATKSTITQNIADFDMNGSGNGGGVFNSGSANFISNNTEIFDNTPEDIFPLFTSTELV